MLAVTEIKDSRRGKILFLSLFLPGESEHKRRSVSIAGCLGQCGEVLLASTKERCLDAFLSEHPDVVVILYASAIGEVLEVTRLIRASEKDRRAGLVVLSPYPDSATSATLLETGASDVLCQDATKKELVLRVGSAIKVKREVDDLRAANYKLFQLSRIDDLTGLGNMRGFNETFAQWSERYSKGECGLGVIMFDLDHFKSVNDDGSHLFGSHCIAMVGWFVKSLACLTKDGDLCARYGGDEFIIATLCDDPSSLQDKAEALREGIEKQSISFDGMSKRITASVGASFIPRGLAGVDPRIALKAADEMLYESKAKGRNAVSISVFNGQAFLRLGGTG